MAALGHTVDTDGISGDYASLNALEAAQNQDLTDGAGDTYAATCQASTGVADTVSTVFSGWTTDVGEDITVIAAPGHEAIKTSYDVSRYRLEVSNDECIYFNEEYCNIIGIQMTGEYTDTETYTLRYGTALATSVFYISGCRIRVKPTSSGILRGINGGDNNDSTAYIYNTIIENIGTDNSSIYGMRFNFATTGVYNCIVYGCYRGMRDDGAATIKNSVVFKSFDDFLNGTVDSCASDDNTGTNNVAESGGGADWPDDFVDAANGDFTLKVGSGLKGTGINDPGGGLYSTDIEGDNYVVDSWSLGVDEFVAVGAALSLPIAMAYYGRIRRTSGD